MKKLEFVDKFRFIGIHAWAVTSLKINDHVGKEIVKPCKYTIHYIAQCLEI